MIASIATSTAASSRSPSARSFQMSTIAMHGASPTRISPVRYSGRSGSISHASVNITIGPTNQLKSIARPSPRRSASASPTRLYFTLASTGYIITSNPIAIGNETVPIFTLSSRSLRLGMSLPSTMPSTIAAPIHVGRNRFSSDKRCRTSGSSTRSCVRSTSFELLTGSVWLPLIDRPRVEGPRSNQYHLRRT